LLLKRQDFLQPEPEDAQECTIFSKIEILSINPQLAAGDQQSLIKAECDRQCWEKTKEHRESHRFGKPCSGGLQSVIAIKQLPADSALECVELRSKKYCLKIFGSKMPDLLDTINSVRVSSILYSIALI